MLFTIVSYCGSAQPNLVPNPSFEQYTQCPTSISNITQATGWYSYTLTTPDYYNCTSLNTGIPRNFSGYQYPASGNGYAGIISFQGGTGDRREYITTEIPPLAPGTEYSVAMSINLGNISSYAINDISVFFIKDGPKTLVNSTSVIVTPHVTYTNYGVIKDTANWIRIKNNFIADSAYTHFVIGSFGSLTSIDIDTVAQLGSYAYYNIDSVEIKKVDSLHFDLNKDEFCAGDALTIPYFVTKKKQSNNVFTLQLSNASGSFASPVNLGTVISDTSGNFNVTIPTNTLTGAGYKMRIVASNYPDTTFESIILKIGNSITKPVAGSNSPVCANSVLALLASTTSTGATYRWTGPANFTSTVQNPIISTLSAANNGNYIVTAAIHGCKASDTTTVIVDTSKLIATISSNSPICERDTLKLSAKVETSNVNYNWTGSDNFISNSKNPTRTNIRTAMAGEYVLLADNNVCTTRATVVVVIHPVAENFYATYNAPVCVGQLVNFSATSTSSGVTYSWTGPNSFSYTGANPFIGAGASVHNGNYVATAVFNGCSIKDTVILALKPLPAKPTAGADIQLCSGDTLHLSATTATTGATYKWTGPDNFSAAISDTSVGNTTTAMSGDYIVTVTADGCSNTDTVSALIKQLPAAITTASNSPLCDGDNLSLTSTTSSTGSTYTWRGPNSFSANTQNAGVTTASTIATGWYVATVDLNGCALKDSTYAVVNPIPAKPTINYNTPLCASQPLNLTANNTTGATYSWTGPNSFTAATQNPVRNNMQYADTGKYSLAVTVNGCTSPVADVHVKINPVPFVVTFANTDTICAGQQVLFTAIPNSHGGTPLFQWYINNIPVGTGITYNTSTLSHNDIIRCDMLEFTKCSGAYKDESNDITMQVFPWLAPSVSFTANPNRPLQVNEYVTFTATPKDAGPYPTYQWKRNGKNVQGATGAIWSANTLNDNDSISVEIFSSYRCPQPPTASAKGIIVKVLSSVNDVPANNLLQVYPNPASNFVIFELDKTVAASHIVVINAVGQMVYQSAFQAGKTTWDTEQVAAGVYTFKLMKENEMLQAGRVVITK